MERHRGTRRAGNNDRCSTELRACALKFIWFQSGMVTTRSCCDTDNGEVGYDGQVHVGARCRSNSMDGNRPGLAAYLLRNCQELQVVCVVDMDAAPEIGLTPV